jgi:hypothetical protein
MASCFVADDGSTSSVAFNWAVIKVALIPGSASNLTLAPPGLDAASRLTSELSVGGSPLNLGLRYTLRVTGCMLSQPAVCGMAETDVALCDEPLAATIAGGSRQVGTDTGFTLDACSSRDPDDPASQCNANGECGSLNFE